MGRRTVALSPAAAAGTVLAAAATGAALTAALMRKSHAPRIVAQPTPWNQALLALCPSLTAPYTLPTILNNGHVETIFAALFRRRPHILYGALAPCAGLLGCCLQPGEDPSNVVAMCLPGCRSRAGAHA